MKSLLNRLAPHWPSLHERAGTVAAHAQLWLTAAMMLGLFLTPGEPTAAKAASPSQTPLARVEKMDADGAPATVASSAPAAAKAPPAAPHTKLQPPPPTPAEKPVAASSQAVDAPTATFADLPDMGADYRKIRRALINKGFRPAQVAPPECRGPEPSVDACWGALVEFPEIESCQGKNGAACVGWWVAPDGRVLNIRTGGDRPRITDRHWASSGEIDELPKGWRP